MRALLLTDLCVRRQSAAASHRVPARQLWTWACGLALGSASARATHYRQTLHALPCASTGSFMRPRGALSGRHRPLAADVAFLSRQMFLVCPYSCWIALPRALLYSLPCKEAVCVHLLLNIQEDAAWPTWSCEWRQENLLLVKQLRTHNVSSHWCISAPVCRSTRPGSNPTAALCWLDTACLNIHQRTHTQLPAQNNSCSAQHACSFRHQQQALQQARACW